MDIIKIGREIDELESGETTWNNVQRLAMLYSVYEHLSPTEEGTPILAHKIVAVMPECGIGEFEEACTGKEIIPLIEILSEHMEVAKALYPKEYQAVIERIKESP